MVKKSVARVSKEELDFAREKSGKNAFSENKNRNLPTNSQNSEENHSFSRSHKYNNKYINTLWNKYQNSLIEFFKPYGVQDKGIVDVRDEEDELVKLVALCDHFDVHFDDFDCFVDYNVTKRQSSGSYDYMNDLLNWADERQDSFSENLARLLWINVFGKKFSSSYPTEKKNYDLNKIDEMARKYRGKFSASDIRTLSDLERNEAVGLANHIEYGNANIEEYIERRGTR